MSQTIAALRTEILADVFPIGVPDNLTGQVNNLFTDALIDLNRWVECLQKNNTTVVRCCNTYFDCGLTVLEAPKGRIKRVYTIANDEWCDRVYYTQVSYGHIREERKKLVYTAPDQPAGAAPLPMGVLYPDSSSDDTVSVRARRGDYAIHRRRLYLMPWLQSNESVVIEWEGVKVDWADTDVVDYAADVKLAIKHYIRMAYARDISKNQDDRAMYQSEYSNQRGDLYYECREETRERPEEVVERYMPSTDQIDDDVAP